MECSIQLLEFTLSIERDMFDSILNYAYNKAIKKGRSIEETDNGYVDESLNKKGISVAYHNDKKKKKIIFTVYPELLISDNSSALADNLENRVNSYFNEDYSLDDFKLSRVIIAADIEVSGSSKVNDYIKLLNNIGRVKCFSPLKRDKDNDNEKVNKEHCFALKGNSNGVEFMAYQSKHKKNILRAEVRLNKPFTIRAYSGDTNTSRQIKILAKNCEAVFMDTFKYIVPRGDYYKKPKAEKLIREKVSDYKMRLRMIHLLALIPEKKSLHLAQKTLNYRNVTDIMAEFARLNISPITISKRHNIKCLESLYSYI